MAKILNLGKKAEHNFGNQCGDHCEEIDSAFPTPKTKKLDIAIFVDSDHGHDRRAGRPTKGTIGLIGSAPASWLSKRQSAVQTATFGAEFTALKRAVEEAVLLRCYMRSLGVMVTDPVLIFGDNQGVIDNSTDPGSVLKKKYIALAYHFCRERQAGGVVDIRKILGKHNCADGMTKPLDSTQHNNNFGPTMEK